MKSHHSQRAVPSEVTAGFHGGTFEITFENLDPVVKNQLVRSADLSDDSPTVVDGPRMSTGGGARDFFSDDSPLAGKAFYVLEIFEP